MKNYFVIVFMLYAYKASAADSLVVNSPDKKIVVTVNVKNKLQYSIRYSDKVILFPSNIDMALAKGSLSDNLKIASVQTRSVNDSIISPVPEKRKVIPDVYNELIVKFKKRYSILFRVYNDGVAYRIVTAFKDSIVVINEVAEFNFKQDEKVLIPIIHPRGDVDHFHTSFEELYQFKNVDSIKK